MGLFASVFVVATAASCARATGAKTLSVKQVAVRTKPGIVRVAAGHDRVGSGFIVDHRGLVVTNLHVVAGANDITVKMASGQELKVVQIAAVDPPRDLVLLRVSSPDQLPTVPLGDSDKVEAGDPVISIGNPLGVFDYTISDGLISSIRVLSAELTVLQISAPISQGSSGGPLFNSYGEVIGISTAIVNGGQNINFALPSNYIRPLLTAKRGLSLTAFADISRGAAPESRSALARAGSAEVEAPADVRGGAAQRAVTAVAVPQPEVSVPRTLPSFERKVFAGCSAEQLSQLASSLRGAIASGAPLCEAGNAEACFRIYQGTAALAERAAGCKGVRKVLAAGRDAVADHQAFAAKAMTLRDLFDGLLVAIDAKLEATHVARER